MDCLLIRNSRALGEGIVCMLEKGFELKLMKNKPKACSTNTVIYTHN